MTKRSSRFQTALFCLFLGGLLVFHILLPDRARSETENRTLAQLPAFSWSALTDGSYTKSVEEYFADQFPLRDQWTGMKARTERLLGKSEFNGVYLCGDTLISKVEEPDMEQVEKNLSYVMHLAENTDARVILGFIPSAAQVWADRLPDGAPTWDQAAFVARTAELGLPTADVSASLNAHAQEPVFYRTDHHWTTLGAYYGYTALMKALDKTALPAEAFSPQTVSTDFHGTLYSQSGIHDLPPDSISFWAEEDGISVTSWRTGSPESAALYERTYLAKKDKYSAFLGGNQPLCVIQNEKITDGSKLLVVRDSYSDSLAPFLAQSFSEVHLRDLRYYRASVARYAAEHGIGDICVLYSVPNFITEKNLVFLVQE